MIRPFGLALMAILLGVGPAMAEVSPAAVVRSVQERLQARRHYEVGPVTGVLGPATHLALWYYQEDKNLRATGQPDRETLASLGLGAAARSQPPASSFPQVAQIWGEPPAGGGYLATPFRRQ